MQLGLVSLMGQGWGRVGPFVCSSRGGRVTTAPGACCWALCLWWQKGGRAGGFVRFRTWSSAGLGSGLQVWVVATPRRSSGEALGLGSGISCGAR